MNRLFGLIAIWLIISAFTPARPRIRYSVNNQTTQSISSIVQLESNDSSFAEADTTEVTDDLPGGFVGHCYNRNRYKTYIKLLIQTNTGRYNTPSFAYKDRCTAYTIEFTERDVSVRETTYYQYRSQVVQFLIIFLITLVIKGIPFLLNDRPAIKAVFVPFLVWNSVLILSLLFLMGGSFARLSSYIYVLATILILELISYYWLSPTRQQRNKLLTAALLGSLLWIGGGIPMILLFYLFFGGC